MKSGMVLGLLAGVFAAENGLGAFQPHSTRGDNLIHVTTADFDDVGAKDYVVGMSIEGKVIAFNRPAVIVDPAADNRLWEYQSPCSFNIMIDSGNALTNSPGDEILLPGTDGRLRILSSSGALLKDWALSSGVLYGVDVGVTSSGATRIIAGGADGRIYILDETGAVLSSSRPSSWGVVRRVVVGNYDGVGGDEVVAFYDNNAFSGGNSFTIIDLDTLTAPTYWGATGLVVNDVQQNMGWTDKQLPHAFDMDEDGDDELVGHWGVLHPENGAGTHVLSTMMTSGERLRKKEEYTNVFDETDTGKYLLQQGIPGNFRNWSAWPGPEMFTLYGDDLYLVDYDMENETAANRFRVKDYGYAHTLYHFTDGARLEDRDGGLDKIVLAGPPNGDDHFYVVSLNSSQWKTDAKTIDGYGVLGEVRDSLDDLESDIASFSGTVAASGKPIWYIDFFASSLKGWNKTDLDKVAQRADEMRAAMDVFSEELFAPGYDPQRIFWTASFSPASNGDLVQPIATNGLENLAMAMAEREARFCLNIGKGPKLYITPEHLADIFEASYTNGQCYMMARTKELSNPDYIDVYKPHMDAVIERAQEMSERLNEPVAPPKIMFCTKGAVYSVLTPEKAATYFPAYKDVFVPGVENSNVSDLDWSFAERAGLWLNGDVESWGCNSIGDNLTPNRVTEFGGMRNGHVVLRHLLSQYVMGADVYRITSIQGKTNPLYERDGTGPEYSSAYRQGIFNFLKIVESGVYPNGPDRARLKGVSPVAAGLRQPNYARLRSLTYNHNYKDYAPQAQDYVINYLACWDAYRDVPDVDLTSIMLNTTRRWDNLLPTSPSGFVPVVPYSDRAALESNAWCNRAYETDGDTWDEFGSLTAARDAIAAELVAQRTNTLFYMDGECFWQIAEQKYDPDTLFAALMDSNFLSPTNREIQIKKGSATGIWAVYDQLGSQTTPIGVLSNATDAVSITIPAGSARFLALKANNTPGGGGGSFTNLYPAVADTYSKENFPIDNYGSATNMQVRKSNTKQKNSYLKFNVTGTRGTIESAKLRVHVGANPIADLTLHTVADTAWGESTLIWNNAPPIGGGLGTISGISANTWYEWDVLSTVTSNALYAFALKTTDTQTYRDLSTRESANAPVLEIIYASSNQAPRFVVAPINASGATEGADYVDTLVGSATDDDLGDALTYSKIAGPAWLNVSANGQLSGVPDHTSVGPNVFTVRVEDESMAFDTATLNITVIAAYDAWASANGLTTTNGWKTADVEPDGVDNWTEFLLGGDPNSSDAELHLPTGEIVPDLGTNWLEYVYRRRGDHAALGLDYTVETSTNLVSGGWNGSGVTEVGHGPIDSEMDSVTNRVSTDEESEVFIRLRVE